jgi:hypothetical protein
MTPPAELIKLVAARHGSNPSGPNAALGPENGSNTTTLSEPFDEPEELPELPALLEELDDPHAARMTAGRIAVRSTNHALGRIRHRILMASPPRRRCAFVNVTAVAAAARGRNPFCARVAPRSDLVPFMSQI